MTFARFCQRSEQNLTVKVSTSRSRGAGACESPEATAQLTCAIKDMLTPRRVFSRLFLTAFHHS